MRSRSRPRFSVGGHAASLHGLGVGEAIQRSGTRLVWKGRITPTERSDTYEVLIECRIGDIPLIYVAKPRLQLFDSKPLPHVYSLDGLNMLCLYLPAEWSSLEQPLSSLVPWVCEWLFFYEVWLVTGEWHGKGVHPQGDGSSNEDSGRRSDEDADGPANDEVDDPTGRINYLERLRLALADVYGPDPDMDELLYNAYL